MDETPAEAALAWVRESDSDAALELRFEIFMDELEAHADPAFGGGSHPDINRASRALMDALHAAFALEHREPG